MQLFSTEGLQTLDSASDNSIYLRINKLEANKAHKVRVLDGIWAWRIFVLPEGESKQRPIRSATKPDFIPPNATEGFNGAKPKWALTLALMVWDYASEAFKVMEIHQTTILEGIKELQTDENWGDVREYDLNFKRVEKDGKVSYKITPLPKTKVPKAMAEALASTPYRMENLYEGGHPFGDDAEVPEDSEEEALDAA
jgi:hypothetical protein